MGMGLVLQRELGGGEEVNSGEEKGKEKQSAMSLTASCHGA